MKIKLDTKAKTITVEENVNIKDLVKFIKKILPKDWESYSLHTGTIMQWSNPIYIDRYIYPSYPWYGNPILCTQPNGTATITTNNLDSNTFTTAGNESTYCIETGQSQTF